MNPEQENFEQLRRMMKLKRYEQPPPRYFKDFSSQVIARISTDGRAESSTLASWLERLGGAFRARPALSGVFGTAICAALIGGAAYSEQGESSPVPTWLATRPAMADSEPELHSLVSSTNPVIQLPGSGSLFDQIAMRPPVLANFRVGGN